jgi:hypothetical protein
MIIKPSGMKIAEGNELFDYKELFTDNFELIDASLAEKAKLKGTLNLDDYASYKVVAGSGYDYQPAIKKACDDLVSKYGGGLLIIPPGTFDRYSDYSLPDNVGIMGTGYYQSVFNSKSDTPAITLNNNSFMMNIKIVNTFSTSRGSSNLNNGLLVYGDNVLVENVWISGAKGAGLMVATASDVIINKCIVENTFADGFHITDNSKNVVVMNCIARETGDDAYAVVSYQGQINPCKNISIINNYSYHSKSRGVAIVGAYDVTVQLNKIDTPTNAGIYIAQETTYTTFGVDQVDVYDNKIFNANSYNQTTNYGAIHVTCQDVNFPITNVKIMRNKMINSRWRCMSIGGTGTITNMIQNLIIRGNDLFGNTNGDGISFNNCQDLIIEDNKLKNIYGNGVYDNASMSGILTIKRNRLENINTSLVGGAFGIIVRSLTISLANVTDNTVIDNGNISKTIQINFTTPAIYERNVYPGTNKTGNVVNQTTMTPIYVGQLAINAGLVYIATGTSATTDWKQLN